MLSIREILRKINISKENIKQIFIVILSLIILLVLILSRENIKNQCEETNKQLVVKNSFEEIEKSIVKDKEDVKKKEINEEEIKKEDENIEKQISEKINKEVPFKDDEKDVDETEFPRKNKLEEYYSSFIKYAKRINLSVNSSDNMFYKTLRNYYLSKENNIVIEDEVIYSTLPGFYVSEIEHFDDGRIAYKLAIDFEDMPDVLKKCYEMIDMITVKVKVSEHNQFLDERIEREIHQASLVKFNGKNTIVSFEANFNTENCSNPKFSIDKLIISLNTFGRNRSEIHSRIYNENNKCRVIDDWNSVMMLSILTSAIRENCTTKLLRSNQIVEVLSERNKNAVLEIDENQNLEVFSSDKKNNSTRNKKLMPVYVDALCRTLMTFYSNAVLRKRVNGIRWFNEIITSFGNIERIKKKKDEYKNYEIDFFKSIYYDKHINQGFHKMYPLNDSNSLIVLFLLLDNDLEEELKSFVEITNTLTQLMGESFCYFEREVNFNKY